MIIQFHNDAASDLQRGMQTMPASQELLQVAREFGLELEAMHPGSENPSLAAFFTATVLDPTSAERIIGRLQRCKAAYLKPDAEPPCGLGPKGGV